MLRLMCITAHPDDEAAGFGGSLRLYRDRGVTADWKPPIPPAPTIGAAAQKAAVEPEPRGPGVLAGIATILRINTSGGQFEGVCDKAGATHAAPYAADYVFLRK